MIFNSQRNHKEPQLSLQILLLFWLYTPFLLFAQTKNLVPNGSFEDYKLMPDDITQGPICINYWSFPNTEGTGEYYHSNSSSKKSSTKKNSFGKQQPYEGKAYAGICITNRYREYLQCQLKSPLIKDKKYYIRAMVSLGDRIGLSKVDEFNVIFSKKSFYIAPKKQLKAPPTIRFEGDFSDSKGWMELTAIYTAKGDEKYLTFGSFSYVENGIEHGKIKGLSKYAHYYIDDISLSLIQPKAALVEENVVKVIPKKNDEKVLYKAGETYEFNNLLFMPGESRLVKKDYEELNTLIDFLIKHPEQTIIITGHTDDQGTAESNQKLSLSRALSASNFLSERGIDFSRITLVGLGESVPIRSNDDEEGRKRNRRVEITLEK